MFFNCIPEEREGSNSFESLSCDFVGLFSVIHTEAFCFITFSTLKMNLKRYSQVYPNNKCVSYASLCFRHWCKGNIMVMKVIPKLLHITL